MAEKDLCIKKLLRDKHRFADLFNAILFHGEQVLQAENLELLPEESGIIYIDKEGIKRSIQRFRDLIMWSSFGVYFAILACEGQGSIHYGMPVRNMLYDALDYTEQIKQLEKKHKEQGDLQSGAEFLSHISKNDRLTPIINLTLYYGKNTWDGAMCLYDLLGLSGHPKELEALRPYLSDYRLNFVDARNISELENFQTSLQFIFGMLKYNSDKTLFHQYVKDNREAIRSMDDDSIMAVFALLGEQKRLTQLVDHEDNSGGFDMCLAIDELIADGVALGEARGVALGEARGVALGEAHGAARMSELISILLEQNQQELLMEALKSETVRQDLFRQYQIL